MISFHQDDASHLSITLSGDWRVMNAKSCRKIKEQITSSSSTIRLIPGHDFHWDSQLTAFFYQLELQASQNETRLDFSAMPEAIQQTMTLATAVPPVKPEAGFSKRFAPFYQTLTEAVETLAFIGEMALAFGRFLIGRSHIRLTDVSAALHQAGPQAIGIITLISILVGMILAYLGIIQLQQFGAEVYVANLVGLGMVREMGALMTAVIMAGRTGAAWAAELGAMKVNEEVDALSTMGINAMDFLVMPRLLAMIIIMPLLCIYSFFLGMIGGGVVALGMDMTPRLYIAQLIQSFGVVDMAVGCFKGLVFGVLIVLSGCQAGMSCGGSSAAVGQATTRAVVMAIVLFVVADAGINILFFHMGI
ncbi:MlaE family ABC transporter permease [Parendozoicomonas haliclonae]|uniref:Putative phospholipid ABC transporter permease protein MlaE n=1 Tax=Parendozoicomonas haliclonae TaxID=1960125 RepID=A0A1X7AH65_9GAMM|nr:ABC transporter permease [Parendozoicomonas haliclonae]SMA40312.1 putative phospholipid ABC transporter permease protein MlaE [Parendozoicomonas haliclonae]